LTWTVLSYCSKTGRREARFAEPRRREPVVDDRVRGQRRGRDPDDLPAALEDRDVAVGGHDADDGAGDPPPLADLADRCFAVRPDDREHPFLALRDEDLEGGQPRLPAGHGIEVDEHAGPGPVGGLRGRAGDAAGAEVLEPLDEPALDELERRLDEELLGERVADLNGWSLGLQ
jgi:hypothetical protein